jgi:hypothetical protein
MRAAPGLRPAPDVFDFGGHTFFCEQTADETDRAGPAEPVDEEEEPTGCDRTSAGALGEGS